VFLAVPKQNAQQAIIDGARLCADADEFWAQAVKLSAKR
jgi:hypothetical protein